MTGGGEEEKESSPPTLVVLAAGIGSRYGGLKQIEPIGAAGEAVLDYAVFDARRAGFGRFVFVIRREIERDFREKLASRFGRHVDVHYAFQELDMLPPGFNLPAGREKPWGTGHALLCAEPRVRGPFAVINADDFYGAESYQALGDFLRAAPPQPGPERYAMVGFQLALTLSEHGSVARGVCRTDENGNLVSVEELTAIEQHAGAIRNKEPDGAYRALTGCEITSLNCWGFRISLFAHLRRMFADFLEHNAGNPRAEFFLPSAVNALIDQGAARVQVLPTPCRWFGMTYRQDRAVVVESIRAMTRAGVYPEKLWA